MNEFVILPKGVMPKNSASCLRADMSTFLKEKKISIQQSSRKCSNLPEAARKALADEYELKEELYV